VIRELGDGRRIFLCEELTLPEEKIREVTAGELTEVPVSSRAIILIIRGELLS
jgi:precorrin-6B methylase 1